MIHNFLSVDKLVLHDRGSTLEKDYLAGFDVLVFNNWSPSNFLCNTMLLGNHKMLAFDLHVNNLMPCLLN